MTAPNDAPNQSLVRTQNGAVRAPVAAAAYPIRDLLAPYEAQITGMLPKGVAFDRVVAELYQVAVKTPTLMKVPAELLIPELCRALGTEGIIGVDVYLVPFYSTKGNRYEVSTIIDYKYKAAMVVKAGGARAVEARAVFKNEPFEVHYGTNARLEHQPLSPETRGELIGAYAVARMSMYVSTFVWMPLAEIEAIRATSKQWSDKQGVRTCPPWYAKKSAVNQLVKLLPKSPRMRAVQEIVEQEERGEFEAVTRPSAVLDAAEDVPALLTPGDRPAHIDANGEEIPSRVSDDDDEYQDDRDPILLAALDWRVNGTRLGDKRDAELRSIRKWANDEKAKGGDPMRFDNLVARCEMILAARERGEIAEPAKEVAA